ncbi:TPA: restriction endonuclease subunit S [Vibrio vulnificus]
MSKYPSDWLSKPLGKVYPKIVVGYVGNVNDHYCRAEEGVPFYRTLNIRDGYFRHSEHLYVTHEFNEKNKKSQITNNDILIARVGANLGMVCKANGISGLANMANAIIIKTNDVNSADADFYTSFLLSPMGKNQIYSGAAGGAQGVFNTKLTQEIIVPVPPLPEQRKIAQILSTWDRAIATTEKLIDASKQQKKALMQQLLTGKKRLIDPETGKAFEGDWENTHLSNIASIKKGKALSAKNLVAGSYPVIAGGKSSPYSHVDFTHENVITVSASGAYAGYVSYHPYKIWASDCSVVTAKPANYLGFIFQWLQLNQIRIYSMQSGGAQPHIYPKDLEVMKLRVPKIEEQEKIASVLTAADEEIKLLETKLVHFKQEKKALMQQLLTGKRRVKVAETEAA